MDAVYDAAFARAGILRVNDLDEVFDAVETLASCPDIRGGRLAIVTNGGGVGVLATDSLIAQGGTLAALSKPTIDKLNAALPPTWSHGNPVDIIGDAGAKRYADTLAILADTGEQDAILVLNCPTAVASGSAAAEAVAAAAKTAKVPFLTNWLGAGSAETARRAFAAAKLPSYDTPEKATRGFMHMVRYRRLQGLLMEVPPSIPQGEQPDRAKAREILSKAKPGWLDALAVQALLACYCIPIVRLVRAADAEGSGGRGREDRRPGGAQDLLARHHPQIRRRRRGAGHRRRRGGRAPRPATCKAASRKRCRRRGWTVSWCRR